VKIAINTIPLLSPLTGVGNYTYQLVRHFNLLSQENHYTYYYGYFAKTMWLGGDRMQRAKGFLSNKAFLRTIARVSRRKLARFHLRRFDLYFEPNFIPMDIRAKRVVTTVHDFSVLLHPEFHPADRVEEHKKSFYRNIGRSNRIITVSSFIRSEAKSLLRVADEEVVAIPLGVDHELFKEFDPDVLEEWRNRLGLPKRFILFVGTKEPRKNLAGLLKAYIALPETVKNEFKLVLAGPVGWKNQEWEPMAQKLGSHVMNLGYLDATALPYLYNLASLFVFPSLYEGFGLPPLEAMACGCPVVVSRAASLPEVCGDAGYYVDPRATDSIAEGMLKLLNDETLRQALSLRGIARSQQFSWDKTAKETLRVFAEVLNGAGQS
jgi:glycosyltransferase involved in cell wall biosynthesis